MHEYMLTGWVIEFKGSANSYCQYKTSHKDPVWSLLVSEQLTLQTVSAMDQRPRPMLNRDTAMIRSSWKAHSFHQQCLVVW